MSTANVRNVRYIPGRLYANPTDLSTTAPFGGTALGLVRDMIFKPIVRTSTVTAEEFGSPVIEAVYAGEQALFSCVLREFDSDAISAIFPNSAAGSTTGDRIIQGRVSGSVNRPGYLLSNKQLTLLFMPRSLDHHPCILMRNAIPAVDETMEIQLSLSEEVGMAVNFYCTPDSSGRVYDIGRRADLSLV